MDNIDIEKYSRLVTDWAVGFIPKMFIAILILVVGFKLVVKLMNFINVAIKKAGIDQEIEEFLSSIIELLVKAAIVLIAASIIGVELSALFGVLAAAGFAIGLALQGFMGNFASGLTIIFFKPYKIGDWVSIADTFGKVESIQIFSTSLTTPGEKTLIIPNGQVTDNIITNFSKKGKIRIELKVSMPYEESFPKVKEVILDSLKPLEYILHDPAPLIGIESYDSHNLVVAVRPYIHPDNYWDATFEVYSHIKTAFKKNGIQVAYSEGVELGPIGD